MKRWFWKRWVWASVFGFTAAVGLALGEGKDAPPSAPPKVGDVITLKFEKGSEKQVKILKTEKLADGSYESEVKDMKTGEVFTLLDKSHKPPADHKAKADTKTPATTTSGKTTPIKQPDTIKATDPATKAGMGKIYDPMLPGGVTPATAPTADPSKDRKTTTSKTNTVAAPTPMPEPTPEKKPGLFARIFGKKPTPTTPATSQFPTTTVPSTTMNQRPTPAFNPPSSVFETGTPSNPAFRPTPIPSTTTSGTGIPKLIPPTPNTTTEPPRASTTNPPKKPTTPVTTPPFMPPNLGGSSELSRPVATPNTTPPLIPPPATTKTPEPPKTLPIKPVTPPMSVIPVPVTPPTTPPMIAPAPLPIPTAPLPAGPSISVFTPSVPAPTTTPVPVVPVPAAPSVPMTPPVPAPVHIPVPTPSAPATPTPVIPAVPNTPSGLPTIPVPPSGMSAGRSMVMQAGYTSPVALALAHDIQPHVTALRTAMAPSVRVMAARALAGGRHASTDTVKSILFLACTTDPCPFVRASCIDELCKLGYYDPAFMAHLHKACADDSEEVRTAAKDALAKMTPHK